MRWRTHRLHRRHLRSCLRRPLRLRFHLPCHRLPRSAHLRPRFGEKCRRQWWSLQMTGERQPCPPSLGSVEEGFWADSGLREIDGTRGAGTFISGLKGDSVTLHSCRSWYQQRPSCLAYAHSLQRQKWQQCFLLFSLVEV